MSREKEGRVSGAAHHLDVGPCVTVGDDSRSMREEAGDTIGVGVGDSDSDDPRVEIIGEDPVREHVRRMTASVRDQVGERPAEPQVVLGTCD